MSKIYLPRQLTEEELSDLDLYNLTMGNSIAEINEHNIITTGLGSVGYATAEEYVFVDEFGRVTIVDNFMDMMRMVLQ